MLYYCMYASVRVVLDLLFPLPCPLSLCSLPSKCSSAPPLAGRGAGKCGKKKTPIETLFEPMHTNQSKCVGTMGDQWALLPPQGHCFICKEHRAIIRSVERSPSCQPSWDSWEKRGLGGREEFPHSHGLDTLKRNIRRQDKTANQSTKRRTRQVHQFLIDRPRLLCGHTTVQYM